MMKTGLTGGDRFRRVLTTSPYRSIDRSPLHLLSAKIQQGCSPPSPIHSSTVFTGAGDAHDSCLVPICPSLDSISGLERRWYGRTRLLALLPFRCTHATGTSSDRAGRGAHQPVLSLAAMSCVRNNPWNKEPALPFSILFSSILPHMSHSFKADRAPAAAVKAAELPLLSALTHRTMCPQTV
jgi:hypothetical protein